VCDGDWYTGEQPERYEATFSVWEAIVFVREGEASKYLLRIHEVDSVVTKVFGAFPLVSLVSHLRSVDTLGARVNAFAAG